MVLELGTTAYDQFVAVDAVDGSGSHLKGVDWLAGRPAGVGDCEYDPAHSDTLKQAGFAAAVAVTGVAEVRTRLEADGDPNGSAAVRGTLWSLSVAPGTVSVTLEPLRH